MASWRPALEGWLRRGRHRLANRPEAATDIDWRSAAVDAPLRPDDAMSALLKQIEATALAVYHAHGLPVRHGHYSLSPRTKKWTFVAESLTPEERWALALAKPADAGWRFATLDHLGSNAASSQVVSAANLLAGVRHMTASMRDSGSAAFRNDLEAAIQLGAEWRALQQSADRTVAGRLKLAPPLKTKRPKSRQQAQGAAD